MTRFKKGTKVVCVGRSFENTVIPTFGGIYTVIEHDSSKYGDWLKIADDNTNYFTASFIPVSEIEPFAVRHDNKYELDELTNYGKSMGLLTLGIIRNEYPMLFISILSLITDILEQVHTKTISTKN